MQNFYQAIVKRFRQYKGRKGALEALDKLYAENSEGLRRLAQEDNS